MHKALSNITFYPYQATVRDGLIGSIVLHTLLSALVIIGLPYMPKDVIRDRTVVNVDIVDISDLTRTKTIAQPQKKLDEPKMEIPDSEPAKSEKMTAEAPPDLLSPQPPELDSIEPSAMPDLQTAKQAKPEAENKPVEPPPQPRMKPKPPPKPAEEKPDPKPEPKKEPALSQEEKFGSLLRNLAPDAAESTPEPETPDMNPDAQASPDLSQIAMPSDRLTLSEIDAIKNQIAHCWIIPAGAKNAEDLTIDIRVIMNRDATVNSAQIVDQSRYDRDPHYRAAADAALRALHNPRCQPLRLPEENYDQWRSILIRFDPSDVL